MRDPDRLVLVQAVITDQLAGDVLLGQGLEVQYLASRGDGLEDLLLVLRDQDEHGLWRRLLDQLEQFVRGGDVQLFSHPDDHHLVAPLIGFQGQLLDDLLGLVDPDLALLVLDAQALVPVEQASIGVTGHELPPFL